MKDMNGWRILITGPEEGIVHFADEKKQKNKLFIILSTVLTALKELP
jgi:methanogenic corrinoid protein MtbC1